MYEFSFLNFSHGDTNLFISSNLLWQTARPFKCMENMQEAYLL